MSHAVHFRSSDGSTTFEEAGSLDDALARVEQLRNEDGVSEVRVYREVPVTFRTYYKATVVEDAPSAAAPAPGPASREPTEIAGPPVPASPPPGAMPLTPPAPGGDGPGPAPDDAEAGGRGSLFSRG